MEKRRGGKRGATKCLGYSWRGGGEKIFVYFLLVTAEAVVVKER